MRPSDLFRISGELSTNSREVSFTLNGHFSEKLWGGKCKFSVNFHFDFYLSHFTTDKFSSNDHMQFCKFFVNENMPFILQRTFFRKISRYQM